jgi:hypothetical protein
MRTIGSAVLAAAVLLVVFAGGCGDDTKCTGESANVDSVANCRAKPGESVSYQLRLCPTCYQTLTGCTVDLSDVTPTAGTIFLNPTVDSCQTDQVCGPSCLANPSTCSFTIPANAVIGTEYIVEVHDPGTAAPVVGTLTIADEAPSCALPPI